MKEKRFMRIIKAKDIIGKEFVPTYPYYEVIYTHEKFVALGIDDTVIHCMNWDNVEDYFM